MTDKPLRGVVVCDYGQHGAGSACGRVLADWGAEVIKVEPVWGDPSHMSGRMVGLPVEEDCNPHYELINCGKKSIAVNLKTPQGMEIMDQIIARSNIFFSNYRLASLKKFGLDYETLSAKYPRLIWGHLSGFGTQGYLGAAPGFDNASYWAYGGLLMEGANPDAPPKTNPFGGGDVMTGYVLASSMAACLYQQAVTGKGQSVYTSLYGTGCWQDACVIQGAASGSMQHSTKPGPLDGFKKSADNVWFTLGIMDYSKIGPRLAKLIGREDWQTLFAARETLVAASAEVQPVLENFFATHTWPQLDEMLASIDIVRCRVNRPGEVASEAQAIANGFVSDYVLPNGSHTTMVSTPVKFGREDVIETAPAPYIGEQTTEILTWLGYEDSAIRQLMDAGIIAQHNRPAEEKKCQ